MSWRYRGSKPSCGVQAHDRTVNLNCAMLESCRDSIFVQPTVLRHRYLLLSMLLSLHALNVLSGTRTTITIVPSVILLPFGTQLSPFSSSDLITSIIGLLTTHTSSYHQPEAMLKISTTPASLLHSTTAHAHAFPLPLHLAALRHRRPGPSEHQCTIPLLHHLTYVTQISLRRLSSPLLAILDEDEECQDLEEACKGCCDLSLCQRKVAKMRQWYDEKVWTYEGVLVAHIRDPRSLRTSQCCFLRWPLQYNWTGGEARVYCTAVTVQSLPKVAGYRKSCLQYHSQSRNSLCS